MRKYDTDRSIITKTAQNNDDDLALINSFTRRELTGDEVYTFSLMLCDNEADRDGERFAVESLFKLAELFVGKAGVYDHKPSAEKQLARIYKTWVEAEDGAKTSFGEQYFKLMAKAYIPRTEGSEDIIARIDSGILKEVSVSCSVAGTMCSVCGEDISLCSHRRGAEYGGEVCCGILLDPTDAYEWSFVAVPAQRNAGVVKGFSKGEIITDNGIEGLRAAIGTGTLKAFEKEKLLGVLDSLEKLADDGRAYREHLTEEVKKYALLSKCGISGATLDSIVKALDINELRELRDVYEKRAGERLPLAGTAVQSYVADAVSSTENDEFKL